MPRIHQLPPSVVTKIAAGEVIERPASVVKELLENAIDAGSRRVDIDIEEGGAELIRVVDDGCGILADDLSLAFASHATSKLGDAEDLFRVSTLGFRGEALASIGGVAQVTLQSRPHEQPCGAEITCHGGQVSPARPWNGSPGTRMEVRHLFFNTPVRRKFLKTISTEMGHISEVFTRVALSHAELNLTLRHNGKDVYQVPPSAGLLERLGLFFGAEVRDQLYRVEAHHGPVRLHGYIADPSCERGTARMQYLFVNGRWIRDRSLGHALQEAYRGLLMTGRYAVAFLFLDVPADQVDVNVHPTKVEVRFATARRSIICCSARSAIGCVPRTSRHDCSRRSARPAPTGRSPD
jgi:DNA mismatch repair protein MutL